MTVPIIEQGFVDSVLAIHFAFEGGKQSADETRLQFQSKLKEAEASQNLAHQGKVLEYMGVLEYYQNNMEDARRYYEEARRVYLMGQHQRLIGMLDLNIGILYFQKQWYDRAKDYCLKAYSLAEQHQYTALQAFALNNYGYILYFTGEYQKAQNALEKAYRLTLEPWNDITPEEGENLVKYRQRNLMNVYENLALVAFAQERYEIAWDYCQKGMGLALENELKTHEAHFSRLKARLLSEMPELEPEKSPDGYFEEALRLYEQQQASFEISQTYIMYCKSCLEREQPEKARDLLAIAKKIAIQHALTKDMVEINDLEVLLRTKA